MISDRLTMVNAACSTSHFPLREVDIGAKSFVGNSVTSPAGAALADNCPIGTKALVPMDGAPRHDVGLLGSPCIEIPRSVARDRKALRRSCCGLSG